MVFLNYARVAQLGYGILSFSREKCFGIFLGAEKSSDFSRVAERKAPGHPKKDAAYLLRKYT